MRRGRTVVTVHDLSFLRFPQFCEDRNLAYLTARIRDTVQRADAILTDSEFSAREAELLLGVERRRLFPIYPGVEHVFCPKNDNQVAAHLRRLGVSRPYWLTVGTLEPRKNIPFLVELFERAEHFTGCLVLAGARGWKYGPIFNRIRVSRCADRIHYLAYISEQDLPFLYAGADVFLMASYYEGFGFPPLEAMACGTPVVACSRGSLPEVLGSGAVFLDAFDTGRWLEAITRVSEDPAYRRSLIESGRAQVARYTWDDAARKTWAVYHSLMR